MAGARIIARNLIANWVGQGANLLVMFFLSPFVIHQLGLVAYGLWSALNVLVGYMGVLDLGIRASTGRHVILYTGREDHRSVDETIRTSLGFFSAMGIAFIIVGTLLGLTFPSLFPKVPEEYRPLLITLLPIMGISMWVSMLRIVINSVLSAHDRFDLARSVELVSLAVRTVGTIVGLLLGYGLSGLVGAVLIANIVGFCCTFLVARKIYPALKIWPFSLTKARLKELFSYGIPAAITSAAVKIMAQTDVIVVSACIGFGAAGVYTAGANLINYSAMLMGQIAATFFPPVQRAVAKGEMGEARWLFIRQVRLGLILGLPLYIGFIMFGHEFLHLWLYDPKQFPADQISAAAIVLAILSAAYLSLVFRSGAESLLAAMGLIRFTAGLAFTQAIINLFLSLLFVLVLGWGLAGVAAGTLVAKLLTSVGLIPWYISRKAGLSLRWFAMQVIMPGILTGSIFAGACFLIRQISTNDNWLSFALKIILAILCYAPIAFVTLLPVSDRKRLFANFKLA